jgi:hypothetical protein
MYLPWIFCIQALSSMPFAVRLSLYTGIWDLRNITLEVCFSQLLVYAATHSLLATNYSRAAIITDGIHLGVLRGGVRRQL